MTSPQRLQLSRKKGFDLQAASRALNGLPAISAARPGPLGNPFVVGVDGDRKTCVDLFTAMLGGMIAVSSVATPESQRKVLGYVADNREALRGHNLACWCGLGALCHVDPLLQVLNAPRCT